jgi:hypothetical protein
MQSANPPQPVIHCNAMPTGLGTTTAGISPPLCRTSRHWRCVYSARQQEEPVRRLPKKLAGLGVVLADLAPTCS